MSDFLADPRDDHITGQFRGEGGKAFWLVLSTGMLTLLTLGIYRFWAKTKVRRYLWSSTAPGGTPFEYTGTGLEKLLGFLVAIIFLAVYLGIMQLALFYFGLSLFTQNPETDPITFAIAVYIPFFAILPLIFYAQYRGRRYLLSRTRWRGVRFAAEKGAMGYMWRAIGYFLLSAISLGLLSPLASFKLEKFMADRTWYGDAKFEQGGRWPMLYKAMVHIFLGLLFLVLGVIILVMNAESSSPPVLGLVLGFLGYVWLIFGGVYYQVHSHRILSAHKVLGEGIRFQSLPRTGTIIGTYIIGSIAVGLIMLLALIPIFLILAAMGDGMSLFTNPEAMAGMLASGGAFIVILIVYLAYFALAGALSMVFITLPILKHYVEETTILNASELDTIRQRAADDQMDAEGFADALDVGAAF